MGKAKKTLLAAACACALVVGAVAGTVAWLSDSESVTNTFTVGKIELGGDGQEGLDEAKVDEMGVPVDKDGEATTQDKAPRVTGNTYKLVPGHTYIKDPTVHVAAASEDAWVFVKVENGLVRTAGDATTSIEAATVENGYQSIADQITKNDWMALAESPGVYYREYEQATAVADYEVFGSFKLADDADVSSYSGKTIKVTAYAIQKDGIDDASTAWSKVSAAAAEEEEA